MTKKLRKSLLYTYGTADLFFSLMISMELYFFARFLTDYARMSLGLAGKILGITSLIDIFCALAGGLVLQKVTLRYGGKYRSWFLVGPPLIAPLFILQFTRIGSDAVAAVIVVSGFLLSHLLFNVVFAANGAMVGRLTPLPEERTILSASRSQGMSVAGLIFSFTAAPMIALFTSLTDGTLGFTLTVSVYALLMILGYWYLYRITAGYDPYDEDAGGQSAERSGLSLAEIVGLVFYNRPLLLLIVAQVFSNASYILITTMATYYFTYSAKRPGILSVFIFSISVFRLLGALAAPWIGVRIGKRTSYWAFCVLAAAGFASARLAGEMLWLFLSLFCVSIFFMSVATSMTTALFADTVTYGEWKTGKSIRAFTMALMNVSIKVGILIRSVVVAGGLMLIGFVANADPTPKVADGIHSMMTLWPAAGYAVAAAIFYFGYRLEDGRVVSMQAEIEARRAAAGD
ncbi:MAG: MFS transporter [Acidobacteriota bacterium]|jgi:Na+/melibiose symporter-like transporter|nr:MFS transporter [Acidobacteriota bacterium]NLT31883.1 hypothetical protein [Acidobacteriota bacterium]